VTDANAGVATVATDTALAHVPTPDTDAGTTPPDLARAEPEAPPDEPLGGVLPPRWRLVSLTFLMLFVELALIRWLGANVVYMSYYSNFVLLGSFLGFGLGFLWVGRSARTIFPLTPVFLGTLVAYVYFFPVPLKVTTTEVIFFNTVEPKSPLPREVVLLILFTAVAAVTACIGDGVARTFGRFEPLEAYRLDLIGSVAGIAIFTLLSFLGARPVVWGLIITAVLLATLPLRLPSRAKTAATTGGTDGNGDGDDTADTAARVGTPGWRRWGNLALAGVGLLLLIAPLVAETRDDNVIWSPYYKITHWINSVGGVSTKVNQSPHWAQIPARGNPLYERVYERLNNPDGGDVLVIGAGSGNDVSVALSRGARHVDAVEIDPRLMDLAKHSHPDKPYDDPRVTIHIDDGRAFLERSNKKWDRILLALPDSLALVQGQSAIRLESYLFTVEAAEAAQSHLKPGGAFAMYNYYRQDWLVARYANTLAEVFHQPPCVSRFGGFSLSVLVASDDAAALDCPAKEVWAKTSSPEPVVDDHPFPYIRNRSIPGLYLITGGVMLLLSLVAIRVMGGPLRAIGKYADLFFMGVAFLLLETKNVTQFALLFGTTWLVNALVFLGVLLSVLVAVAVSRRVTFRHPIRLYVVLLAALALAFAIPPDRLLDLSVVPRFVVAVSLAFFPIFTANLVFTQRFKATADSTVAFGANLLGAMVGGLLEYVALITGFRMLLVVVAIAYGLAFLTGRRHLIASAAA
jgi:hypothetical protein